MVTQSYYLKKLTMKIVDTDEIVLINYFYFFGNITFTIFA